MKTRFKKNAKIFDIAVTAVAGIVSVCVMLYAVACFVTEAKKSKITDNE